MSEPRKSSIEIIVTEDNPILLVSEALALAKELQRAPSSPEERKATKTQVRRLFSTLRQIEMQWPAHAEESHDPQDVQDRNEAYRELVLFGPRMAYQSDRHKGLRPLASTIQEGIRYVNKSDRRGLERLTQFFEATVAYYLAGPGQGGAS